MRFMVLVICIISSAKSVFGLRCFECNDMPIPTDCNRITSCGPTESCYVEQVVTSGGIVLYNSGCRSHFKCASPTGKRFLSTDILACSQCCNTDFCNNEGCGITAPSPQQRGPYCFECDAQSGPDSCRDTVTCDFGHACFLEKVSPDAVTVFYRSRCIEEKACISLQTVTMATGQHCPMCCRTDFCNDKCPGTISYVSTRAMSVSVSPTREPVETSSESTNTRISLTSTTKQPISSSPISPQSITLSSQSTTPSALQTTTETTQRQTTTGITQRLTVTSYFKQTSTAGSTQTLSTAAPTLSSTMSTLPTSKTTSSSSKPTSSAASTWSSWSTWNHCHCQVYTQTRRRHCIHGHHHNDPCPGPSAEYRNCTQPNTCHTHSPTTEAPTQKCNTHLGYHLYPTHSIYGMVCWKLYKTPKTWHNADLRCHHDDQHAGHLVVVDASAKQKVLTGLLHNANAYASTNISWIGLSFSNGWHWANGTPIQKKEHHSNSFIHHLPHPFEHCVGRQPSGGWIPVKCHEEHIFVCEIS